MTYMKHTLAVCLGSLVLALLGACSSDNEVPQPGKEEGHRVDIVLSGSPAAGRTVGTGTRALVVTGNPAQVHPELENPRSVQQILNPYLDDMAIGSTVRLLVWPAVKNKTDGKWERTPNTAPLNCTFVVRGDADTHFYYLRPCSVKADGSFDKEVGTPLILRDGDWIIYAASPALPLGNNAELKLTNGQEYMSSDWRYVETYPTYFHLEPLALLRERVHQFGRPAQRRYSGQRTPASGLLQQR